MSISRSTVHDQVAAFLYAIGVVHDNEDIIKLELGGHEDIIIPMKIHLKQRQQEVTLIKHNGGTT